MALGISRLRQSAQTFLVCISAQNLNFLDVEKNDFDEDAQGYGPEQDPMLVGPDGFSFNLDGFYDTNEYAKRDHKTFVENLRNNKN